MTRLTHGARLAGVVGAATLAAGALAGPALAGSGTASKPTKSVSQHVLLISVDGMHQSDLAWYVRTHPKSVLAGLVATGTSFSSAMTPFPSDSFPGMVGQVTGGNPKTTGIYYDVSYNHALLPPGTTSCKGATPGTVVAYDESIDKNQDSIDAGQGLSGLPGSILQMTAHPETLINQAALPVDPSTCKPVMPNQYLKVNTVFDVLHAKGMRTAWSDKHPAYSILNGPSGNAIDDLFTPEINSLADAAGNDWTKVNSYTQQYDQFKVQAVLNEIDGLDHSGKTKVGVPALLGMNFQSVSTAEKLPVSGGQAGGYLADGKTPGPVLRSALDYVNTALDQIEHHLAADGLTSSTTVILSAKHGQSPTNGAALTRIDDGAILDGLNAAWAKTHPKAPALVAGSSDDDGMLLWLSDRSAAATSFARNFLAHYNGSGTGKDGQAAATGISGAAKAYTSAGLDPKRIYAGAAAAHFIGVPVGDSRVPDLIGIAQYGTVFTGGTSKIAEHGGDARQDRNVPLVVSGAGVGHGSSAKPVETTQIAPTILALLGLSPSSLQAVQIEHTAQLPLG